MNTGHTLFYISNHGLGHAVRTLEIAAGLKKLAPEMRQTCCGGRVGWLFRQRVIRTAAFRQVTLDVGVCERNLFDQDELETLQRYQALLDRQEPLIESEVRFLLQQEISLVVADVPPLAFRIASRAGVPSIGIGNFTWAQIYQPFVDRYPQFSGITDDIIACHRMADGYLEIPFGIPDATFPQLEHVPLIGRPVGQPFRFAEIGIEDPRPHVLLLFRKNHLDTWFQAGVRNNSDFLFLSFIEWPSGSVPANYRQLPEHLQPRMPAMLAACHAVIAKLGYGMLVDCVTTGTPLLYPPRQNFAEFEVLRQCAKPFLAYRQINHQAFVSGAWSRPLHQLLAQPKPAAKPDLKGADVCARKILELHG